MLAGSPFVLAPALRASSMRIIFGFLVLVIFGPLYGVADTKAGPNEAAHLAIDFHALRKEHFQKFDPDYLTKREVRESQLAAVEVSLRKAQADGHTMACSEQIYVESKWLLHYTADWQRFDRRLNELSKSLANKDQQFALEQSAQDGAWGACYEEWFHKLDASVDGLNELADQEGLPKHRFSFLDRVASPDALRTYLNGLRVSDIAATGRDHRNELGAVTEVMSQLLFKKQIYELFNSHAEGFTLSNRYVDVYQTFLDTWQDPKTGYWGAWYLYDGRVVKSADLSLTYHTVAYRKGNVNHLKKVFDTTLALRQMEYPYGWLVRGKFNNHNNYDVVRLFKYGWPELTESQQRSARAHLTDILDWTLNTSLRSDGSFVGDPAFYNSLADAYYYGVSVLDKIGYWSERKRFWTEEPFVGATAHCRLIRDKIVALDLKDLSAHAAKRKLKSC